MYMYNYPAYLKFFNCIHLSTHCFFHHMVGVSRGIPRFFPALVLRKYRSYIFFHKTLQRVRNNVMHLGILHVLLLQIKPAVQKYDHRLVTKNVVTRPNIFYSLKLNTSNKSTFTASEQQITVLLTCH